METPEYFLIRHHPDGGFAAVAGYDIEGPAPEAMLSDWRFPSVYSAANWAISIMPNNDLVRLHREVNELADEPLTLGTDWANVSDITDEMFGAFANGTLDVLDAQEEEQVRLENEWSSRRGQSQESVTNSEILDLDEYSSAGSYSDQDQRGETLEYENLEVVDDVEPSVKTEWLRSGHVEQSQEGVTNSEILDLDEYSSTGSHSDQDQRGETLEYENLEVVDDVGPSVKTEWTGSSLTDEEISEQNHPFLVAEAMFALSDLVRSRASSLSNEFSEDYIRGLRRAGGIIENEARIYTRSRVLGVADSTSATLNGLRKKLSALTEAQDVQPGVVSDETSVLKFEIPAVKSFQTEQADANETSYEYSPSDLDAEVLAIASLWKLNSEQTITLLHKNTFRRTALIYHISLALINSNLPDDWMAIPNALFSNKPPIDYVESQGVEGLAFICKYLDDKF